MANVIFTLQDNGEELVVTNDNFSKVEAEGIIVATEERKIILDFSKLSQDDKLILGDSSLFSSVEIHKDRTSLVTHDGYNIDILNFDYTNTNMELDNYASTELNLTPLVFQNGVFFVERYNFSSDSEESGTSVNLGLLKPVVYDSVENTTAIGVSNVNSNISEIYYTSFSTEGYVFFVTVVTGITLKDDFENLISSASEGLQGLQQFIFASLLTNPFAQAIFNNIIFSAYDGATVNAGSLSELVYVGGQKFTADLIDGILFWIDARNIYGDGTPFIRTQDPWDYYFTAGDEWKIEDLSGNNHDVMQANVSLGARVDYEGYSGSGFWKGVSFHFQYLAYSDPILEYDDRDFTIVDVHSGYTTYRDGGITFSQADIGLGQVIDGTSQIYFSDAVFGFDGDYSGQTQSLIDIAQYREPGYGTTNINIASYEDDGTTATIINSDGIQGGVGFEQKTGYLNTQNLTIGDDIAYFSGTMHENHWGSKTYVETIIFDHAISDEDRDYLEQYLAHKHGNHIVSNQQHILTGGSGFDVFSWHEASISTPDSPDTITDFDLSIGEQIELNFDFKLHLTTRPGVSDLNSDWHYTIGTHEIIFYNDGIGNTLVDITFEDDNQSWDRFLNRLDLSDTNAHFRIKLENIDASNLSTANFRFHNIVTTADDEFVYGTMYGDILNAAAGDDNIIANEGDDSLIGGLGQDTLLGGDGVDSFVWYSAPESTLASSDIVKDFMVSIGEKLEFSFSETLGINTTGIFSAAIDNDIIWYEDGDDTYVAIDLTNDGVAEFRVLLENVSAVELGLMNFSFDNVLGSSADETILGTKTDNFLVGGMGRDILTSYAGDDILSWSNAAESTIGNHDVVTDFTDSRDITINISDELAYYGPSGYGDRWFADLKPLPFTQDKIELTFAEQLQIVGNSTSFGAAANEIIWYDDGAGNTFIDIEIGSDNVADFRIELQDFAANSLSTEDFNFTSVMGSTGVDNLFGTSGNDTLYGSDGDDLLVGGLGVDFLYGGDGDDLLIYDSNDTIISGGSGSDILRFPQAENNGVMDFRDFVNTGSHTITGIDEIEIRGALENTVYIDEDFIQDVSDNNAIYIRSEHDQNIFIEQNTGEWGEFAASVQHNGGWYTHLANVNSVANYIAGTDTTINASLYIQNGYTSGSTALIWTDMTPSTWSIPDLD